MDAPNLHILRDRALMFAKTREFFAARKVLEVDCPILSLGASVDAHIDLFRAQGRASPVYYLHSSPEYGMKQLLAQGIGDIYQLSHVFRDGETSAKHNPEFTMVEWYRTGIPFPHMIEETLALIREFLGPLPSRTLSYREAFKHYAQIDYAALDEAALMHYLAERSIEPYASLMEEGKDALLNTILGLLIEPCLGQDELTVLQYYPASQAMLAQTQEREGEKVAERFEIYFKGIELANGYHELGNPAEQRMRLIESNAQRKQLGKETLPIDEDFIAALERGLPDCCGVAVGFDRLMMLRHEALDIAEVCPLIRRNGHFQA